MMAIARRSLTEPPGLNASTLAYSSMLAGAMRFRRTIGVPPMVPRMLSWIMANPMREGEWPTLRPSAAMRTATDGTPGSGQWNDRGGPAGPAGDPASMPGLRNARAGGWLTPERCFRPGLMAHVWLSMDPIDSTGFHSVPPR